MRIMRSAQAVSTISSARARNVTALSFELNAVSREYRTSDATLVSLPVDEALRVCQRGASVDPLCRYLISC